MPLDLSLATPRTELNPMASYQKGGQAEQTRESTDLTVQAQYMEQQKRLAAQATEVRSQDIVKDFNANQKELKGKLLAPLEQAQIYSTLSSKFFANGDMTRGNALLQQSRELRQQSKEIAAEEAERTGKLHEASALAAQKALDDPSDENVKAAGEAYSIANGKPPTPFNTAEARQKSLKNQAFEGMSAKERLSFAQKDADQQQKRKDQQQRDEWAHQDRLTMARGKAAAQQGIGAIPMDSEVLQARAALRAEGEPMSKVVPRGKAAAAESREVEKEVIRQMQEDDPDLSAKQVGKIMAKRETQLAALRSGASAYERTASVTSANIAVASEEANGMIEVARGLADKVQSGDTQAINQLVNAVQRQTGDVNITNLDTALNALANSYARAINPKGVSTVSDKQHARELLNAKLAAGQLSGAFDVMQLEMKTALASAEKHRAGGRDGGAKSTPAITEKAKPISSEQLDDVRAYLKANQ